MARLGQKILTTPGKYITVQKVKQLYNGSQRPDNEIIQVMMQELCTLNLGLYVMKLGFVKYKQPDNEDLSKYEVSPQVYTERYNTPILPSHGMNASSMRRLDSVVKTMPAKPPLKIDR